MGRNAFDVAGQALFRDKNLARETITYYPAVGTPRVVKAIVDRSVNVDSVYQAQPDRPSRGPYISFQVTVSKDQVSGVSKVVKGKDRVGIKATESDGSATLILTVTEVIGQTMAWQLLCQK